MLFTLDSSISPAVVALILEPYLLLQVSMEPPLWVWLVLENILGVMMLPVLNYYLDWHDANIPSP